MFFMSNVKKEIVARIWLYSHVHCIILMKPVTCFTLPGVFIYKFSDC